MSKKSAFVLRPDQQEALRNIRNHFVDSRRSRGKYISACGTGKTVVLAHLPEVLDAKTVVFFVPSLNLVEQTWKAFDRQLQGRFDGFIVCSDDNRAQNNADNESDIQDLSDEELIAKLDRGAVLHTPEDIAERLNNAIENPTYGPPTIVFCTYQSSHILLNGVELSKAGVVDLAICDEAHRLASEDTEKLTTMTPEAVRYPPRVVVRSLKARRRLFVTATPKSIGTTSKNRTSQVYSMDDITLFGSNAHVYPYANAVLDGVVAPFDIMLAHVDKDAAAAGAFLQSVMSEVKRGKESLDASTAVSHEDLRSMVVATCIAKLRENGCLNRVLTYNSSIKRAEKNAEDLQRVGGVGVAVSSQTPVTERVAVIRGLDDGTTPVVANCRLFGEGHDTPDLDGVAFVDPKNSVVDIAQAIGRAARIPINPVTGEPEIHKRALVIVPVDNFTYNQSGVLERRDDGAGAVDTAESKKRASDSPFAIVQSVLSAMDTPGMSLHECSGDFEDSLINRFDMGRAKFKTSWERTVPEPVFGKREKVGMSEEEFRELLDSSTALDMSQVGELYCGGETTGISESELNSLIGTPSDRTQEYSAEEEFELAPKILEVDVLNPSVTLVKDRAFVDVADTLRKYVSPEKVDKTKVIDGKLHIGIEALEIAASNAAGVGGNTETDAILWRTLEYLRHPILRTELAKLVKDNAANRRTTAEMGGEVFYIDIDPKALESWTASESREILNQLSCALEWAVFASENGGDPSDRHLHVSKELEAVRRQAASAQRTFMYWLAHDKVTARVSRLLDFIGFEADTAMKDSDYRRLARV